MNAIEVKSLNVWYGKFKALNEINFYVPKGLIAGLIGPNGAGKTTLIKSIVGILPYEGEIEVIEGDNIGYLAEDEGYYGYLTGYEYLRYFSELYGFDRDKIYELLKLVGLDGKENVLISKYSKGMKRRLGIARTLLSRSSVIILDEPLSGLDPNIKSELRKIILEISKERTFLISSHQLRDIEEICDWIIMINEGKLLGFGKPEDLLEEVKPVREIVIQVKDVDESIVEGLKRIEGVKNAILRGNIITIEYGGDDDSEIFKYLLSKGLKFNLKSDTLESIYREVYR